MRSRGRGQRNVDMCEMKRNDGEFEMSMEQMMIIEAKVWWEQKSVDTFI